jgi:hypothetical protein
LQVVDDGPDAGNRSCLAARGIALRFVVDGACEGYYAVSGLHGQLLAREARILAELALNVRRHLCVIGLARAARGHRENNC